MLVGSHFIIMCAFIYSVYKFSQTKQPLDLCLAFAVEYGLSFFHYVARAVFSKTLAHTNDPFNKNEMYPELIRGFACLFFLLLTYLKDQSFVMTLSDKGLNRNRLIPLFYTFNIVGCVSRFNFPNSMFSPTMANLAISILLPLYVQGMGNMEDASLTPLDGNGGVFYILMAVGWFMLFISTIKTFTILVHVVVRIAKCRISMEQWQFTVLGNIWGIDYLLLSAFILSAGTLMRRNWRDETGNDRFLHATMKYSGLGYAGFYPIYVICNLFLPFFMDGADIQRLRTLQNDDVTDVIRDNMENRKRGQTVRTVQPLTSTEKMITLFQVSPFFFSETKRDTKPTPQNAKKFDFQAEPESNECLICFSRPPNCVILRCMHGGVCDQCSRSILLKKNECPFCRAKIHSIKVIEPASENQYRVLETMVQVNK